MPARLRSLCQALAEFGVTVRPPKSGSHWIASKPGYRPFPLAAHNGERTEIADKYIRGLCRCFDIDIDEFTTKL